MESRKLLRTLSFISLALGVLLYLFYRPLTLKYIDWLDNIIPVEVIRNLQHSVYPSRDYLSNFLIFSLPDGLWVFSYVSFMRAIWFESSNRIRFVWFALIPVIAIGSEMIQKLGILQGTYDLYDALAYLFCAFLPFTFALGKAQTA